jgi:low temperature requirement protein LtrA
MLGTLVMAAAAPEAFGMRGLVFAGAYLAIQIGRSVLLVLLLRGQEARRLFVRQLFWFGVSAVPSIAGTVAHGTTRVGLWTLAVAVDYAATALRLPTPGLGPPQLRSTRSPASTGPSAPGSSSSLRSAN